MGRSGAACALETAVRKFPVTALTQSSTSCLCPVYGNPVDTMGHGWIYRKYVNTGELLLSHLSEAAVLLPKRWQATQGGDGGVTPAAAGLSGGLAVDVVVVPVQVVVTR